MVFETKYGKVEIDDKHIKQYEVVMGYTPTLPEITTYAHTASIHHTVSDLSTGTTLVLLEELSNMSR